MFQRRRVPAVLRLQVTLIRPDHIDWSGRNQHGAIGVGQEAKFQPPFVAHSPRYNRPVSFYLAWDAAVARALGSTSFSNVEAIRPVSNSATTPG